MIGIKKYFLIFSLIFYVTACSPPTRDFSNSQNVGNSTDDLSTKFINVEGKYEFDLPNTWLDASAPNIREGVNTDLLDMNSPMTKLMFQQMEQSGMKAFIPFNILAITFIDDVKEYGLPWLTIVHGPDTYIDRTDAELEAYCLFKERYFKSVVTNPDFEMERCGGSNVLRGKGQQFTKLLNNPYNDYEQYIYTTFMYDDLFHSVTYTCHKKVCDIFFPGVSEILSSFDQYP